MKTIFPQSKFPNTYDALERIFNDTYNGIAILDLNGKWQKVNDSLCRLLGYSREEFYNMNTNNIIFREDLKVHERRYDDLIRGEVSQYQVEQRYFHKNGSIIWFLVSVSLTSDDYHEPYHMIWQFTDISKRKRHQAKLKMMLNVVREQNDKLTSFADIITHNLRSHSGNLTSLIEFLETDYPWIESNDSFGLLKQAIENLEDTVRHLTEIAKIKEVKSSEIKALNLCDYVEKAIYNIAAIARNTNTTITNDIDDKLYVKGIPAYLDSIVLNFLTNAIKYRSDERSPKIHLTSSVQNEYVVFNVKDNGMGIDMDKYGDKLFQMYKTFHCNEDARGIGLFITKNHIESLGGKVIVTSEVNVGTEFSIYLKRA